MASSNASKDRDNVAESLRRFGFGPEGIEAVFAAEDQIATAKAAKRRAKVEPPAALDFGDWV